MFTITKSWYQLLQPLFNTKNYKDLELFLNNEYTNYTVYPRPENVYNALNLVKYNDVKVVIIGQDPYHGINQAHGLSFSVLEKVNIPPSLRNIFVELHNDLGCFIPNNGNLTKWAKQGVLLLNSVLTVRAGEPNSHKNKGWENITSNIIELLNKRKEPIIFLLWGTYAKQLGKNIDTTKHFVLTSSHPSPMSANQGGWFNNHHFSKTNELLKTFGSKEIDWQIDNI